MVEFKNSFPMVKEKVSMLFGDQVSMSYPLPDRINGVRVENFFLYYAGTALTASRPFGLLTVSMESGEILRYQDCRLEDFVDTDEHPFSVKLNYGLSRKIGVKEFKMEQGMINKCYEFVRKFAFNEEVSIREKEVLTKYLLVLERNVPEALLPYYQAMGKNFYDWGYQYV